MNGKTKFIKERFLMSYLSNKKKKKIGINDRTGNEKAGWGRGRGTDGHIYGGGRTYHRFQNLRTIFLPSHTHK